MSPENYDMVLQILRYSSGVAMYTWFAWYSYPYFRGDQKKLEKVTRPIWLQPRRVQLWVALAALHPLTGAFILYSKM